MKWNTNVYNLLEYTCFLVGINQLVVIPNTKKNYRLLIKEYEL